MRFTAAALVRHALEQVGVRYTFGIPGVHNIELYDELKGSENILPVLVTHEGGGAFMADAISRATDSIGVLAAGAVADFVILNTSPLADISNSRDIALVVLRGTLYSPSILMERD